MGKRDELWQRYAQTHDPRLREEIILANIPLVRHVLNRLSIPVLSEEAYNDLVGQGILGLIDAVDRFEPKRGWRFSTYATLRIRGHILDALRAMDLLPRGARRRVKEVERVLARLRTELGREPRDEEVAAHADLDLKTYRATLLEANCAVFSLDAPLESHPKDDDRTLRDFLWDRDTPGPEETLENTEQLQQLEAAIRRLPRRLQILLSLYYYEGLTMKEVGQVLDLSESRVSQLHSRAMQQLRDALTQEPAPRPQRLSPPARAMAPALA